MTVASWGFARAACLRRADTGDVAVDRDLEAKMPDGEVLLADRWFSASGPPAPIVLLRSPYGRRQLGVFGRIFAERGYQAVVQSCRGTFGSGGSFDPFHNERADGLATLEWLAGQPWFSGSVGMFGPSYLGIVQWAVAGSPPAFLKALALDVTSADIRDGVVFPGGSFGLETGATWVHQMEFQERGRLRLLAAMATARRRLAAAYATVPLADADLRAFGHRVGFYQDWLDHELPGDPWWDPVDFSRDMSRVPPASMVAGWHDIFLRSQVADYRRLRDAGREVRLTIGPWTHTSPGVAGAGLRDALDWFDARLLGRDAGDAGERVRVFVTGRRRWVDLPDWPPPARPERWHLQPDGGLAVAAPPAGPPDRLPYDPADPPPGLGGASLDPIRSGAKDQQARESRPDVLTYTSGPLAADLTVAGPLAAEVWVRSEVPSSDVFVRLCDVDLRGRSRNVSDGILRDATVEGAVRLVRVEMAPVARTFRRGHRVRVQVSGGAHPLFARNTGSGERLGAATRLVRSGQEVLHDAEHPSAIELPVSAI